MARTRTRGARRRPGGDREAGRWRSASTRVKALVLTVAGLMLAWGVNAAMPGLVDTGSRILGRPELEVTVLAADSFESELQQAFVGTFLWAENAESAPIPRDHADGDAVPTFDTFADGYGRGAVDAGQSVVRVQLGSSSGERININRIAVDVVSRRDPLRRLHVIPDGGLGGTLDVRYLFVALDDETATWVDGAGRPVPPPSLFVEGGETETIDVKASATQGDFDWRLEVSYSTEDGKTGTKVVRPPWDSSFRTSSLQNAATFVVGQSCVESARPGPRLCGRWEPPESRPQPDWVDDD
ncbi:hypothetical protein NP095_08675 [Aeromicrobium duanguangcaii]|uniref:DUF2207 domain-containing protein n=1 Tax=Aeromicrobium duanguangcaii TaxID=2968086 RepID=A0ABY5KFV9_9ACTN|nr:hypothetical protein [Aeromicrobium duanguangcaii]UUI67283.1 hypothetical protein NP095_08675 [Aeromicrobium duanguangcaii]